MSHWPISPASEIGPRGGGLWTRWLERLERYFSDPARYDRVRSFALTRWMARRRTQQLMGVMTGFVQSQVLLLCVRMKLFELLAREPMDLGALARLLSYQEGPLRCVLESAVSLKLLRRDPSGLYTLGELAHPVLGHAGIRAMVEHNQLLYRDLADPEAFLRAGGKGHMAAYWPYAQEEGAQPAMQPEAQGQSAAYSELMDASQNFVIAEVLDSFAFDRHRCVLDIGCGKGRFASELAKRWPDLQLHVLDLPHVMSLTRQRLCEAGLAGRTSFHGRSFLGEPLPRGADLCTLIRVAHDHPDHVVQALFQQIYQALPAGGRLLLAEPMALAAQGAAQGAREADPYFHFYMLAMGQGRLRSVGELSAMLQKSGFSAVETVPTAMPIHAQILLASK
ncbi:MAG: methyltransferase domain-containing protein [Betaproteobacteria bacterium]|nr:methyltransferase domain-containing protein [Betaproteobacteria bacterium]